MSIPFFYIEEYDSAAATFTLSEDTSRHVIQVLRIKAGSLLHLTDGRGLRLTASILEEHKKNCVVSVVDKMVTQPPARSSAIGISLLKNHSRFEWFLEKATELGVNEIIPLLCDRTEKEKFRYDRMQQICISAMLQSQQVWLPVLHQPIAFELLFRQEEIAGIPGKFIAHCDEGSKELLAPFPLQHNLLLIGPEGDFTPNEIEMALEQGYVPVTLGNTRLRTETAGVAGAVLLQLAHS